MIKGFKEFIAQGNVIDLAVAVVIGAAFGKIVDAMVAGIMDPLIAAVADTEDLSGAVLTVAGISFQWGTVVSALITFLATALVVYLAFVMPMNKLKERQAAKRGAPKPTPESEQELLVQIRDLLAKNEKSA